MQYVAGNLLMVAGLGLAVAPLFVAGQFPATPLWVFLAASVALAAAPIALGMRLANRANMPAGVTPEEAERHHRRAAFEGAVLIGFAAALALPMVVPLVAVGTGIVRCDRSVVAAWAVVWLFAVRLGCRPVLRPLYGVVRRRSLAWYDARLTRPSAPAER